MNQYTVGTLVELGATFQDLSGNLVDPTIVTAEIRLPDDTIVQLTPVVHASLGVYKYDYTPTMNGLHEYRFAGTGAVTVAAETAFMAQSTF